MHHFSHLIPRRCDDQGCGHFHALRGSRRHMGVDLATLPGTSIFAPVAGRVTKVGWPYGDPGKRHIRYVQITASGYDFRVFYVKPAVEVGDEVTTDDIIGQAQRLGDFYPGITEHVHFEIKNEGGEYIDPTPTLIAMGVRV